jgi:hypothetical protein
MKTTTMTNMFTAVVRLVCVFGIAGSITTTGPLRPDTRT